MYHIRLFDENKELLSVPNKAYNPQINKTFNEASERSFLLPDNAEEKEHLGIGREFEIWKEDEKLAAGITTKNNESENPNIITGMGFETYLKKLKCPGNLYIDSDIGSSVYGEFTDLAGIMEDLTYDYKNEIINRDFEGNSINAETDGEIDFTLEHSAILEAEDTGDTEDGVPVHLYPEVEKGDSKGRITFKFEIPESYELQRLRWKQEVAETNNIIYRYRTSEDGSSWTSWPTIDYSEETPAREGFHLEHTENAEYIQVQFQLINEDGGTTDSPTTRTEGYDEEENEIIIYGSTPVLEAIEVIFRQKPEDRKIKPDTENWPIESPEIFDEEFDYSNHLNIARNLCEKKGYEFFVDEDYKLHLSEEFGEDRSEEVIFRQTDNMNIDIADDDDREQANYLIVLGDGTGLDRLRVVVKDEESIEEYGLMPDKIEFTDIEDINELQEKAQKKLEKRKEPQHRFRIQAVIPDDFPEFNLGDRVRIIVPKDDINSTGRIIEEYREASIDGEQIVLGINDKIDSIIKSLVDEPVEIQAERKPRKPSNIKTVPDYKKITIKWPGNELHRIYHSKEIDGNYRELNTARREYTHEGLELDSTHFYKIARIRGEKESEISSPVKAKTLVAPDDEKPSVPEWESEPLETDTVVISGNTKLLWISLNWKENPESWVKEYIIQRKAEDETEWKEINRTSREITTYTDTDGLSVDKEYEYRLFAASYSGMKSEASVIESITTGSDDTPSIPTTQPSTNPGFRLIGVSLPGVSGFDKRTLSYYQIQFSTADADYDEETNTYSVPESPTWGNWLYPEGSETDSRVFIHENLDYSKAYRYRYKAVNNAGNESDWSEPSDGEVPNKSGSEDIAYRSLISEHISVGALKADVYKEIRNTLNLNFHENLDNTDIGNLEVPFHIPSETIEGGVIEAKLSVKATPFRAYSSTASGGAHKHDVSLDDHTHELVLKEYGEEGWEDSWTETTTASWEHKHTYQQPTGTNFAEDFLELEKEDSWHDHGGSTEDEGENKHKHKYNEIDTPTVSADADLSLTKESVGHNHNGSTDSTSTGTGNDTHSHTADNTQPDLNTGESDAYDGHDHPIGRSTVDADVSDDTHSHTVDSHDHTIPTGENTYYTSISASGHTHPVNTSEEWTHQTEDHTHAINAEQKLYVTGVAQLNDTPQDRHRHTELTGAETNTKETGDGGGDHWHKSQVPEALEDSSSAVTETSQEHTHDIDFSIFEDTDEYEIGDLVDIEVFIDNGDGVWASIGVFTTDVDGVLGGEDEIIITDKKDGAHTDLITDENDPWKAIKFEINDGAERIRLSGQFLAKIDLTA